MDVFTKRQRIAEASSCRDEPYAREGTYGSVGALGEQSPRATRPGTEVSRDHRFQQWTIGRGLAPSGLELPLKADAAGAILASAQGDFTALAGKATGLIDLRVESRRYYRLRESGDGYRGFSLDSRWFAYGSGPSFDLNLVDLRSLGEAQGPRTIRIPDGQNKARTSLVFSGDGRWLLAGDSDQAGRLCDLAAPDPYASSVSLQGAQFDRAAFSPDGRWVLLANSGKVQFWPLAEVELMRFAGMLVGRDLSREE